MNSLVNFNCHISDTDFGRLLSLQFYRDAKKGEVEIINFDNPTITTLAEGEPNEGESKPLSIDISTAKKLVFVLLEFLNKKGISSEPESTLRGELKATRKHLVDMQRLIFERLTSHTGDWEVENVHNKKSS